MTFEEFLPGYLDAHADRRTRIVHPAVPPTGLAIAATALARRKPALVLAALAAGCIPAWVSQWVFEGNQPKSFTHPLLSLRGDFVMASRMLRGQRT